MCLDLPAQVIDCESESASASVEIDGRVVKVATFAVPDLAPGDWVRVIAGVAVERIDADAADHIRNAVLEARAPQTGGTSWNGA